MYNIGMGKIIPTIMASDIADLENKYSLVSEFVDEIQIDVMDGLFIDAKSWNEPSDLVEATWLTLPFELHLMIKEPERTISKWLATGAERIIIHIESTRDLTSIFEMARTIGTEIALGINIETPLSVLSKWLGMISTVQLMGIRNIGHQGEPFEMIIKERITELKKMAPHVIIAVDGGVSEETIPLLLEAGASRLAVGSAIFNSGDISMTISKLNSLILQKND
ncbi:MAG: hypothetical protein COV07_04295 [Candidatus Vogelbacteria bacterium CG10_big_fil_rev_8_21_14_0_10_45_14]|uniref:Ribulose-phosphate 3-epimerase n=1 Tax=Candidatus Vogelbacteria bacterium CG10_big_fil_rev_8_21_14_0_10_45_14 TaxID=1975042 RepID=A0A2H0RIE4_9BACT|nr:MAG: hypothetical protein COV07_04295 [Candidatus Vogelbacteria bacterium CG10_big_fil_rev_8_21_14_0_10_45_14]